MAERRRKRASDPLEELGLDGFGVEGVPVPHPAPVEPEAEEAEVESVETLPAIPAGGRRRRHYSAASEDGSAVATDPGPSGNGTASSNGAGAGEPKPMTAREAFPTLFDDEPEDSADVEPAAPGPEAEADAAETPREPGAIARLWVRLSKPRGKRAAEQSEGDASNLSATEQLRVAQEQAEREGKVLVVVAKEAQLTAPGVMPLNLEGISDDNDPMHGPLSAAHDLKRGQLAFLDCRFQHDPTIPARIGAWTSLYQAKKEEPGREFWSSSSSLMPSLSDSRGKAAAAGRVAGAVLWALVKIAVWLVKAICTGLFKLIFHESRVGGNGKSSGKQKAAAPAHQEPEKQLTPDDEARIKIAGKRRLEAPFFRSRIRVIVAQPVERERATEVAEALELTNHSICDGFNVFSNHDHRSEQAITWREIHPLDAVLGLDALDQPANDMFLSLAEVAAIAHPPKHDPPGITFDRTQLRAMVPLHMPSLVEDRFKAPRGKIPLGYMASGRFAGQIVALDNSELDKHAAIAGRAGAGKSEVATNFALGIARSGYSVVVIDPHGALVDDILPALLTYCPERIDDIVLVDPNSTYAPGINPLDVSSEEDVSNGVSRVMTMMEEHSFDVSQAPRAVVFAKQSLRALAFANLHLPPEHKLGIAHVKRFLHDEDFRKSVMAVVNDPLLRENFGEESSIYEQLNDKDQHQYAAPVDRVCDAIMMSPKFRRMFLTTDKLDFPRLIRGNKIILVRMSQGAGAEEQELSEAVAAMILPAVMSTMAKWGRTKNEPDRPGCRIIVDEIKAIQSALKGLDAFVEQARKFDAGIVTICQTMEQLDPVLRKALYANASNKICLALAQNAIAGFNESFSYPQRTPLTAGDVASLPSFAGFMDLAVVKKGQKMTTGPFAVRTLPPPPLLGQGELADRAGELEEMMARVEENSRREIGVSPDVIEARLSGNMLFDGPISALGEALRESVYPQIQKNLVDEDGWPVVDEDAEDPNDGDTDWIDFSS